MILAKNTLRRIEIRAVKKPLKDAAAVNATTNKLDKGITNLLDSKTATVAPTKHNIIKLNLPKK